MPKKINLKPTIKFGLFGGLPTEKGRTPEWDSEEEFIFNDQEDTNYLNSNNIKYSKEGNYYLDSNGKYLPGVIYYNKDNTWNHYQLDRYGIKGYNMKNLSPEQYQQILDLGLDYNKFYPNVETAEKYKPNLNLIQSKLPQSRNIGNISVTYSNDYPLPYNENALNDYLDYGSYHVIDPDNNYDFYVKSGRLRDGGSREIRFVGTYPEEWRKYKGIIRTADYDIPEKVEKSEQKKQALNELLKQYQIQFDKKGNKLISRKFKTYLNK